MREIQFREALREAMTEEMKRDENVFLMGEDNGQASSTITNLLVFFTEFTMVS